MLKLKLQYFGHLMRKNGFIGQDPDARKDWGQEEKGTTEDEMNGCYHQLNGHELEQALGVDDGQGSLVCCSPWGCKELDTTEGLNSLTDCRMNTCHYVTKSKLTLLAAWQANESKRWGVEARKRLTGGRDQDHHQGKEIQKGKMALWGGLTNSCEKKRSQKQRIKGNIYPF